MNREALLEEQRDLNQQLEGVMDTVPYGRDDGEYESNRNERITRIEDRLNEISRQLDREP